MEMASSIASISLPRCFSVSVSKGGQKSRPLPRESSRSSSSLIFKHLSKDSSKHHHSLSLFSSSSSPPSLLTTDEDEDDNLTFNGCRGCGKEEKESGCNGEGRIQGGIATVPGFGWWPIKAYRPCPAFVEAGGRYRRVGQSMDEVAFGRGLGDSSSSSLPSTRTKDSQLSNKKGKS